MSPVIKNKCAYNDALAEAMEGGDWNGIDGFFKACVDANVFDDTFKSQAFEFAAKARIRRDLKRGIVNKDGKRIKCANIVMKDPKGVARRVYKAETLLDVGDCIQVVRYWKDRRNYCSKRVRYYTKLTIKLHGVAAQDFLPLRD